MRKNILSNLCYIFIFSLLTFSFSCSKKSASSNDSSAKKGTQVLTVGGSSTLEPVISECIKVYQAKNPNIRINYETLGSSVGIKQLNQGVLSLAFSSRDLKKSELDQGLSPKVLAIDGLSVVANADVGVDNLSLENLAKVFSGEIKNWKELSGSDKKIELIVRDETSGTYSSFNELVMEKCSKEISSDAMVARENGEIALKVPGLSGSISYVGMAFNKQVEEANGKVLSINGTLPTIENVKSGKYPISRNLYVVTKGEVDKESQAFLDFLFSSECKKIVEQEGFVSL